MSLQDWQEYWVGERNEACYQQTEAHGQGYDAKNLMHTFRLLGLAEQIARYGCLILRVADLAFLLSIKCGAFTYDWLLAEAERRLAQIETLYATSPLPAGPDMGRIEKVPAGIRQEFCGRTGLTRLRPPLTPPPRRVRRRQR